MVKTIDTHDLKHYLSQYGFVEIGITLLHSKAPHHITYITKQLIDIVLFPNCLAADAEFINQVKLVERETVLRLKIAGEQGVGDLE